MEETKEDNVEELKKKLKSYKEKDIEYNDPHFTQQLTLREGKREDVVNYLLNPEKLVYSYQEKGKYDDTIHCLHFEVSNTRTMRLPIIFKSYGKVYIMTYVMRYRNWQNMIKR